MQELLVKEKLILEDMNGSVLRTFPMNESIGSTGSMKVIRRQDTGRIEIVTSTDDLTSKKINFQLLNDLNRNDLAKAPVLLGRMGHLRLIEDIQKLDKNIDLKKEDDSKMFYIFLMILLLAMLFGFIISQNKTQTDSMTEELKQEVVKIVKNMTVQKNIQKMVTNQTQEQEIQPTKTARKENTLKRMGALSA